MADRHRRGYVSSSNQKLKQFRLGLRAETIAAWKEAAARAGMSQRQAAEYMFCDFARKHGIEITPPSRKGWKPPPLDC
jgi:hypothetical protein